MSASRTIAYVAAALSGCAAFSVTLVLILEFEFPNLERAGIVGVHPVTVAALLSALLGAGFSALWPSWCLRLAVLSSAMFWGFFLVVFWCFLINSEVNWVPLGQAVLILSSSVAAALASKSMLGRFRRRAGT